MNSLLHTELFDEVRAKIMTIASPTIKQIADVVCDSFRSCKMKRIEEKYFKPRGLTLEEYLQVQRHLNENVVLRLERAIESSTFSMVCLLVGVDGSGAQIFEISDPGHSECYWRIGFHALGSGLPHAISTFISHNFTPSMNVKKALYITYEAKKNAEKAPGVGTKTDIGIIDENGIKILNSEEINILENIYQKRMEIVSQSIPIIEEMINELPIDGEHDESE